MRELVLTTGKWLAEKLRWDTSRRTRPDRALRTDAVRDAGATSSEPVGAGAARQSVASQELGLPFERFAGLPVRPAITLLSLLGCLYVPSLFDASIQLTPQRQHLTSVFDLLEGRSFDFGVEQVDPNAHLRSLLDRETELPLIDPDRSLDSFFRSLQLAESGGLKDHVHILHYGDSPTTADLITADMRVRMQDRFGNAGHGFSLVAPPWAWYRHNGVKLRAKGWSMLTPTMGKRGDGRYGLGGVSFVGSDGAYSEVQLSDTGHTRVRVYFMRQPDGGTFRLLADDEVIAETDTSGDAMESAVQAYPIPAGARTIALRVNKGDARIFGMEFFKNQPGVVYSSLGLNGASTMVLSRYMEAAHWSQQLRAAKPRLVIINYGTNESVYPEFVTKQLESELRRAIARVREAVPDSAILVMSPMDRGIKSEDGGIVTAPAIPKVVEIQKRVAREMKVAFFNTFEAMGGDGTMARWYARNPRLVGGDYIHPMPAGAKLVGDLLFDGIEEQYRLFKLREMQKSMENRRGAGRDRG